jgi:uncharacterized protein YkwD
MTTATQLPVRRIRIARAIAPILIVLGILASPLAALAQYALNSQEALVADYMVNDPNQKRASMNLDPILARVARERAEDMAARNYVAHVNPDGVAANYLVTQAGYGLPAWWGNNPTDNFIESIAAGQTTPAAVWQDWMNSTPHRNHILAIDPFYQDQTSYGVGYAYTPNGNYHHYWVIITAPPNASTAGNAALFIEQSVPQSTTVGGTYTVSVQMLNTGSNTWTSAAGYHLASNILNDPLRWGPSTVDLPGPISPGTAVTFNFTVTAPSPAGSYDFQWRMTQDNAGAFGEASQLLTIAANAPYVPPPTYSSASYNPPASSSSSGKKSKKSKKKKSKKKSKKKK